MENSTIQPEATTSKAALWAGRIISGIIILFLLVDAIGKVVREAHNVQGTKDLGFSETFVQPLGFILLVITILYIIPRTAILGAVLLTGYLGGAVAVMFHQHVNFLFPIIVGVLAWAGLYFRNVHVRNFVLNRA